MKAAYLTAVLLSAVFLHSCADDSGESEWIYRDDWGYDSKYEGNAAEANPHSLSEIRVIASSLTDAIDFGNGMYNSAVRIMMPDIFDDNISFWNDRTLYGSCYPENDNGTLDYRVWPSSLSTAESELYFNNYCVSNPLTYQNMTIINDNASITSDKTDGLAGYLSESVLKAENLSVKIIREPESLSDNYTFRGYVDKRKQTQATGSLSEDKTVISADMPEGDKVCRFDVEITSKPEFKKAITFYYPDYGYVTADISGIEDKTPVNAQITMKYKTDGYNGGSCTFTPEKINDGDFDCGDSK